MEQIKLQIANDQIINIFGQYDANIKKIERSFAVNIVNRGEDIVVSGSKYSLTKAEKVLKSLISIANRGEEITEQAINYLIAQVEDDSFNEIEKINDDFICVNIAGRPVKPKTIGQKNYIDTIRKNTIVFGIGPAGTGKTYLAMAMAITAFKNNEVNRIILTRPAIEAGEHLGFLPGDLQQKVDPYLRPLYDALYDIMGVENFQKNM